MREAARTAVEFSRGIALEGFLRDRKLQLAVERCIEIIGEAAKRVSEPFKAAHPEVPWSRIIAQRNIITHEYGEILQERIWSVIVNDLPPLVKAIEPHVPHSPSE